MKPKHLKLISRALEHPKVNAAELKTLLICLKLEGRRVGRYMLHDEYHRGVDNPFEKSPSDTTLYRITKKLERLGFLNRYVVDRKYTVFTGRYETAKVSEVSPKVKQLKHARDYRKHSPSEKSFPESETAQKAAVSQKVNISKESNITDVKDKAFQHSLRNVSTSHPHSFSFQENSGGSCRNSPEASSDVCARETSKGKRIEPILESGIFPAERSPPGNERLTA
jgi:hypothetical protein